MNKFTSSSQKIGKLGENIACNYLIKKGFSIVTRNYTKKWGEIDIVARKGDVMYFVEVKSRLAVLSDRLIGKYEEGVCRPEEGMHAVKMERMSRVVQTYILEKKLENAKWQVDLLSVFLDVENKKAKVKVIANIIL